MKISNFKQYINFASLENKSEKIQEHKDTDLKQDKKDKILKYAVAATAVAAVVIGGIYYVKRHGSQGLKKSIHQNDIPAEIPQTPKPENQTVDINPVSKQLETPTTAEPKLSSIEKPQEEPHKVQISDDTNDILPQEKPRTRRHGRRRIKGTDEAKINPADIPDSKKPFVLDKKYFDFSKIKGERQGNVVKQFENGKIKREFAADDGTHLSFYSEFDDNGKRIIDVEFREDTSIKSIRNYKDGEFSDISFYQKDGITLAKKFDNEDDSLLFGLDFE